MLTLGHISSSYLLAQAPSLFSQPLNTPELVMVVASGYILDLDLLIAKFFVKSEANHHLRSTHTPIFATLIWTAELILLRPYFSMTSLLLAGLSMLLHLVLDDIGYWFYKLGWQAESKTPQIFWLYPFDKRRNNYLLSPDKFIGSNFQALKNYFTKAPVNLILEFILTVTGIIVFLNQIR